MRCARSDLVADRGLQLTLLVRVATADESDTLRDRDSWRRQLRVVQLMLLSPVPRATGEPGALTGDGWRRRKRGGRKLCQVEPSGERINIMYSCGHNSMHWLYQWPCRCDPKRWLNYWGRVTHICVSKLSTIGSDNGLTPGWRQAIIWTNGETLLSRTFGTNFNEISSEIHTFSFKKMHLEMSSAKWRPFCLGEDEVKILATNRCGWPVNWNNEAEIILQTSAPLSSWMKTVAYFSIPSSPLHVLYSWLCHQMEGFPRYWPFVMGIHQSPMDSPPKGQWRGALTIYLICAWTNGWANNRDAPSSSLWRHCNASVI